MDKPKEACLPPQNQGVLWRRKPKNEITGMNKSFRMTRSGPRGRAGETMTHERDELLEEMYFCTQGRSNKEPHTATPFALNISAEQTGLLL